MCTVHVRNAKSVSRTKRREIRFGKRIDRLRGRDIDRERDTYLMCGRRHTPHHESCISDLILHVERQLRQQNGLGVTVDGGLHVASAHISLESRLLGAQFGLTGVACALRLAELFFISMHVHHLCPEGAGAPYQLLLWNYLHVWAAFRAHYQATQATVVFSVAQLVELAFANVTKRH